MKMNGMKAEKARAPFDVATKAAEAARATASAAANEVNRPHALTKTRATVKKNNRTERGKNTRRRRHQGVTSACVGGECGEAGGAGPRVGGERGEAGHPGTLHRRRGRSSGHPGT